MNQIKDKNDKSDVIPKERKQAKEKKLKPKSQNELSSNSCTSEEAARKQREKELRKLEWEKKLAEQKLKSDKENLSKTDLKNKRREQQEAQRQAKVEKEQVKPILTAKPENKKIEEKKQDIRKSPQKSVEAKTVKTTKCVQLVQHLYRDSNPDSISKIININDVHPLFAQLGSQYAKRSILGSNSRCVSLLVAIQTLIDDLQTPPKQEYCRYMESVLQICTNYLQECRPFSVSMTNALRHFKLQLTHMDKNLTDNEKKAKLHDVIDLFINNDIKKAWDAICMKVNAKIVNGDVILIYGCSSLIERILIDANKSGKKFSIIVVDSRPLLEGREMSRKLLSANINCTYVLINALSFVMKQATKVLLGAHALLANGSVMSRIGTAQIALVAQACNIPVLVCCETYKFTERVQTDSFVYNEIGDSDILLSIDTLRTSQLMPLKNNPKLNILNLLYDVTPPDLVTAVVTELAILPCSSVPVVLRINAKENI